jgi:hypothetical protein
MALARHLYDNIPKNIFDTSWLDSPTLVLSADPLADEPAFWLFDVEISERMSISQESPFMPFLYDDEGVALPSFRFSLEVPSIIVSATVLESPTSSDILEKWIFNS